MVMSSRRVPLKCFTAGDPDDPKAGFGKCLTCNRNDLHYLSALQTWMSGNGESHAGHLIELLPISESIQVGVARRTVHDQHYYAFGGREVGPFTDEDEWDPGFDAKLAKELGVEPKALVKARLRSEKRGTRKRSERLSDEKKIREKIIERPFGRLDPVQGTPFYEQAIVDDRLSFITVDKDGVIDIVPEIVLTSRDGVTIIRPKTDLPYAQYIVKKEWLDEPEKCFDESMWNKARQLILTYMDFTEPEVHASISLAAIKVTYLSDWFRAVAYLFGLGDTDSGKSQWAREIMARHCFRALYSEDLPGADIYEFLTNSGATIIEDEVQGLEKNPQKMKLYKGGYTTGSKVPRIMINKNTGERRQVFYDSYGVKIFAGEEAIDNSGFMQRCLMMPMVKGRPKKDEFDPVDQPLVDEIRGRLLALRILTAAGKVSIPEYASDEPWFEGRFKQLYKALLSVTPEKDRQAIIAGAQRRYEERRAELRECIEAETVIAYLKTTMKLGMFEVPAENINEELLNEIGVRIPEDRRPTPRSTGMRLTKLGFRSIRVRVEKKEVRRRWADEATLQRLLRKYDLNDVVLEQNIKLPEKAKEQSMLEAPVVDAVDVVDAEAENAQKSSKQAALAVAEAPEEKKEAPEEIKGAQNKPFSAASTASTVTTSVASEGQNNPSQLQLCKETALDRDHEAALEILKRRPDGFSSHTDAVGAVMGLGFDRDLSSLLVNHLTRDGLFLLHPDGRWRVIETKHEAERAPSIGTQAPDES